MFRGARDTLRLRCVHSGIICYYYNFSLLFFLLLYRYTSRVYPLAQITGVRGMDPGVVLPEKKPKIFHSIAIYYEKMFISIHQMPLPPNVKHCVRLCPEYIRCTDMIGVAGCMCGLRRIRQYLINARSNKYLYRPIV